MLMPVVLCPVPVVMPLRRADRQARSGESGGRRPRRGSARFEVGERRDAPSGDPAVASSSPAVLSALLDLPRGG